MGELFQLIACEAFYQVCAAQALRTRILLSRGDFLKMSHAVALDVDWMLFLFKAGWQLPQAVAMVPPSNGRAAPTRIH